MLQFFRKVWQRLWGRLRYCGAVHYLAASDVYKRQGWWCIWPKSTRTAVCPPRTW